MRRRDAPRGLTAQEMAEAVRYLRQWEERWPGAWTDFRGRFALAKAHDGPSEEFPLHLMDPRWMVAALRVMADDIEAAHKLRANAGRPKGRRNAAASPADAKEAARRRMQHDATAARYLADRRALLSGDGLPHVIHSLKDDPAQK